MEQIDVIKRLVEANPDQMEFVTTAAGIEQAFANGKVASLIGMAICRGVDSFLNPGGSSVRGKICPPWFE